MPFASAVVPCGSGYMVHRRQVLGFLPCISCNHVMTVTTDKLGKLRAYCLQSEDGCGSKIEIAGERMPQHSAADLPEFADDIRGLPTDYREHLARSWCLSTDQLMSIINGQEQPQPLPNFGRKIPEIPEAGNPEIPAETAGKSGDDGSAAATGANPGAEPGSSGTDDGAGGTGTGERTELKRGFLQW